MKRVGIYAGSFDPFTLGHLDIAIRASRVVDRLVIAIGRHASKSALLSPEARKTITEDVIKEAPTAFSCALEVMFFDGLLVDLAEETGAQVLFRGLRNHADLASEQTMAGMNKALKPSVETIFLVASPKVSHITGTLVRQISQMGGDVSAFVPGAVLNHLTNLK